MYNENGRLTISNPTASEITRQMNATETQFAEKARGTETMNDNFARPDNDNYFDEVDRLADELGIDEDDAISMISGSATETPKMEAPDTPYTEAELAEIEELYNRIVSDENLDKPESPPALEDVLKWAGEWVIKGEVRAVVYGSWERYGFIKSKRYDFDLSFTNVTDEEKRNAPARFSDFDL